MNVNEHDINTMNGWRREKTKTLMQGSIMRIHNCPKLSVVPNQIGGGGGLFSTNLNSRPCPKYEFSSQSIKKAENKSKRQLLYSATPAQRSSGPDQSTHTAAATPPRGS